MHDESTDADSVRATSAHVNARKPSLVSTRKCGEACHGRSSMTRTRASFRRLPTDDDFPWYASRMKNGMRSIKGALGSKTTKDALVGTGIFGAGEITGACALGCLAIWFALALVIVVLWALVALLAAALPL
jgi:hypothetical protein